MIKKIFKKIYKRIIMNDSLKLRSPLTEKEKELIDELVNEFKSFPVIDISNLSGAELSWARNMNSLRKLVINYDPRRFLQWSVIQHTMVVNDSDYIIKEFNSLQNSDNFNEYWKKGISETDSGCPNRYKKYKDSSENLIHNAYHLQEFEKKTNFKLNSIDFVFEFGGGYGSMCRLFKNLGFNKKYLIFDLAPFSSLQKYYLKSIGHKILTVDEFCCEKTPGILCISDIKSLKNVLESLTSLENKLFIATWSISETPLKLRNEIFSLLNGFNFFLIAYQNKFEEVDNNHYFNNIQKNFPNIIWYNWKIKHLPGNCYLMGMNSPEFPNL